LCNIFISDKGGMSCQVWFKIISMDTMFLLLILGAVALLALLILYVRGKVSGSFMITGLIVVMFIFSIITGR
jgi:hypothetical protein